MTHGPRLLLVLAALSAGACGHARFHTPQNFASLNDSETYQQRATSPDGVVIAARKVEVPARSSLKFWSEAISRRLEASQGYAPLGTQEIKAKSGHAGRLLKFGRDQNGHAFDYWVALFPAGKKLYLLEAGGRRDRFERARADVERAIGSVKIGW
ncbi:MAG TPA: hypothetical protein VFZ61_26890 [Polyangiales bacterium]